MILHDVTFTKQQQPKYSFKLTPHQQILLMPVGDVHAGSEGWPAQRFKDHIQWGIDRGAYFLGMGEYLDFTSTSQREVLRGLRDSQRRQIDDDRRGDVEKLYKPIETSTGRWLGLLEGDHYYEFLDGTTTDQYLCQLLKAPFLGTSTLFDVRLKSGRGNNGCTVTIFAHHGSGGGRRRGMHLHRVEDMMTIAEADIYLMGHSHSKISDPVDRLYRTPGGYLYHRTKILARTGGFLRGYVGRPPQDGPAYKSRGSYVEAGAYSPSALGGLVLSLGYKRVVGTDGKDIIIPDLHMSI
jgi:hypothetical protein